MATSSVDICNSALNIIGASNIISLDEDSKAGRICKQRYPNVRDSVFRSHPWNCLVNRVQLTADTTTQNILYSLYVGRYDSGLSRTIYKSFTSASVSSSTHNSSFVGNETAYIGGKDSNDFGNQLSGSMMEFRYWNTALNSGSFDNHIQAPKSFDGNHPSASYTDLVLRYSFDDNKNLD